jgi:ubiquinone biosynthesis protein COQ4
VAKTPAIQGPSRQYLRAFRAAGRLARDTERTDQVFEIIQSLTGQSLEPTFAAFFADPYGKRLLRTRSTALYDRLSDREALAQLPEGSLGRAYLRFMIAGEITPGGLINAMDKGLAPRPTEQVDPNRSYVVRRLADMHDLWHVLNDYGRDDAGEIANLWFSFGQFGNPGMAFIAFFGTLDGPRELAWWRYQRRAFIRGKRARRLVCAPLEEWLACPLDEVRAELRIAPTSQVHPEGLYVGQRGRGRRGIARMLAQSSVLAGRS